MGAGTLNKIWKCLYSRVVFQAKITRLFLCPDIQNTAENIHSWAGKEVNFMPYIAPEVVQKVKKMDLLTYLKNYEPYELVHFTGNIYTTKSHDIVPNTKPVQHKQPQAKKKPRKVKER